MLMPSIQKENAARASAFAAFIVLYSPLLMNIIKYLPHLVNLYKTITHISDKFLIYATEASDFTSVRDKEKG